MKALIWHGANDMRHGDIPEPVPAPGEALLKVLAVGVCGSEVTWYRGAALGKPPLVMGHEFAARVVRAAPGGVIPEGALVTANPYVTCGRCGGCRAGLPNRCVTWRLMGAHRQGAYAQFVALPERNLIELPEGLDPVMGALTEPLGVALRGFSQAAPGLQGSILVLGAGTIGLFAAAAARKTGAGVVIATDMSGARRDQALSMGATHALDAAGDVVAGVRGIVSGGVDASLDCVGAGTTRRAAMLSARPGGRAVFLGLHEAESALPVNDMVRREVAVLGSYTYTAADLDRAVALLAGGFAPPWFVEERPLSDGPEVFSALATGKGGAAPKVVLRP